MRQLRRLLSVLVMAVTIVGMSMTAFAQESVSGAGGNGSITIENASKGIVYSIYKVFDAKVNAEGTSVAYSTKNFVDNPYFEKDSVGNISAKKEAYKTDSNEQLSEGAIEWIKENGTKICSETSDGSILNITGLPFAYYYVTSTLKDGGMIMVTSVAKDAQIVDKNSKEPQWTPGNDGNAGGKSIVLDDGKQVKENNVSIGETVHFRLQIKLYMYTAIAPIPLSTFAGEPTQNVGKSFIKSYCAVLLEGAVIVLACIIFSLFASSPPVVNPDAAAVTQVWSYIGELVFNMLVLVGAVKMSDRIIREMMGL